MTMSVKKTAAPLARPSDQRPTAPTRAQLEAALHQVEARLGQLKAVWANARTPAQKSELTTLSTRQKTLLEALGTSAPHKTQTFSYETRNAPVLNTVVPANNKPVPKWVLDDAQAKLNRGDRGGAYLALYRATGSEQILIQAQITTYSGVWGSSALTGNARAKELAGPARYTTTLDQFSHDIDQATIDAMRKDLERGGTGRLTDDQLQQVDREVWKRRKMEELFPGNSQFGDFLFGNHSLQEGAKAFFSRGTLTAMEIGARKLVPDTSLFGLNQDGRNMASLVGKRPSEFANNPNYEIQGGAGDRFLTVIDKRTGFVEAFWDKEPRMGPLRLPQLDDVPLEKDSVAFKQRKAFYEFLGANRHNPIRD